MCIVIEVPAELERRLAAAARRSGTDAADFAKRLLDEHLPPQGDDPTLPLFPAWEDAAVADPRLAGA